ncbi:MAG: VOC family protein [Hyphomonadaceae bacterium]
MGERKPSGSTVLVVVTPDVDAAFARLSRMGVAYVVEPADFPAWNVRSSVCKDPEGNLIEIVMPPAAA